MTRYYAAASCALLLLMLTFAAAPASAGSRATAPATNTPVPRTAVALVPSLTALPCPGLVRVNETIDGVPYAGVLVAVCQ